MTEISPRLPRLAALALTLSGSEVLLVRRANPPDQGLWGYPGGKVEFGETMAEAAVRELAEETGLVAVAVEELGRIELIDRDPEGGILYHYYLGVVLCEGQPGPVCAGDDAEEAAWFPFASVLQGELGLSKDVALYLQLALARRDAAALPG